jgi:hypothetical protein
MKSEIRHPSLRPRPPLEWQLAGQSPCEGGQRLQVATDSCGDRAEPRYEFIKNCRQ